MDCLRHPLQKLDMRRSTGQSDPSVASVVKHFMLVI